MHDVTAARGPLVQKTGISPVTVNTGKCTTHKARCYFPSTRTV